LCLFVLSKFKDKNKSAFHHQLGKIEAEPDLIFGVVAAMVARKAIAARAAMAQRPRRVETSLEQNFEVYPQVWQGSKRSKSRSNRSNNGSRGSYTTKNNDGAVTTRSGVLKYVLKYGRTPTVILLFFSDYFFHSRLVSEGYILLMQHLKLQILKFLL
jgi:hypothetical protein